jgi:hypothetical protein
MEFRWNDANTEHLAGHGVWPHEAEQVVRQARSPYPLYRADGKWLVWGRGQGGRYLQVVFVLDEDEAVFVIHARPLTNREKRRFRRRSRR